MVANYTNFEELTGLDKPTDIEIAMRILKLLDNPEIFNRGDDPKSGKSFILSIAENAMETMRNPFAKKLLADQIVQQ